MCILRLSPCPIYPCVFFSKNRKRALDPCLFCPIRMAVAVLVRYLTPLSPLFHASVCLCDSPFPLPSHFLSPCLSPAPSFPSPPLSASRKTLTYKRIMCHMWMCCVTYMNEWQLCMLPIIMMNAWWHTYEWVMYQCEWVVSRIWVSHIAITNASWHAYGWVMCHIWMIHATPTNESCPA